MTCLRCDGKGTYRNEFGLMEKCEFCQRADVTLDKITPEPDPDEEGYWEKREKKLILSLTVTFYLIHYLKKLN